MIIFVGYKALMDPTKIKDITQPITTQCPGAKCEDCKLCTNQSPLLDTFNPSTVFWVGLSAVDIKKLDDRRPLSSSTSTGSLIDIVEEPFRLNESFYRTNLVKCLPLNNKGKIRYPNSREMKACYSSLEAELDLLKPRIVFLLGKQVANFVLKNLSEKIGKLDESFEYIEIISNDIKFIPVHHPSYINVYKSKRKPDYISALQWIISKDYNEGNIELETSIIEQHL